MRFGNRMSTLLLASALAAPALVAQAPKTGWRAEFLGVFSSAEDKYYQLAQAMPWEKYSWRPGKGVRSVCEVFLHISGANYEFTEPLGVKTPADVNLKTIETCPDSKAKVLATMKTSFTHIRNAVIGTPDSDADKAVTLFGEHTTKRGLLMSTAEHAGEHLGQAIAYARTNGVVPPWSK
jgi:uncharacterized damage-inducible protein DinB